MRREAVFSVFSLRFEKDYLESDLKIFLPWVFQFFYFSKRSLLRKSGVKFFTISSEKFFSNFRALI